MIKATLNETPKQDANPFPKLMIRKDDKDFTIILAINQEGEYIAGMVLMTTYKGDCVGEFSWLWLKSLFTDLHGSITLQNETP